jgi:hypothetical protein
MSLRRTASPLLVGLAMLAGTCGLHAAPDLQVSGFATLGAVYTRSDDLQFARVGIDAPGGDRVDLGPDSVLGLQLGLQFGQGTGAVLQVTTRETQRGDYDPRPALAFVSHALTPALTVRAGRLRSPFFMLSDTADINYNQPWVRLPAEVYGLNPFADLDGIDLLHRSRVGAAFIELHPYFGASRIPVIGGGEARLHRLRGLTMTLEAGEFSLSVGHALAELAAQRTSQSYAEFVERTGLSPALQARLSGSGADASFSSLGMQWDDGRWRIVAELGRLDTEAFVNSATGAYIAIGRRFGSLMPYLSLARQHQDAPLVDPALADSAASAGALALFNRSRNQAQRSITLGGRWDVSPEAALKAEFSHVVTDRGAHGSFIARGDPFAAGLDHRSINLLSVSVDVVF